MHQEVVGHYLVEQVQKWKNIMICSIQKPSHRVTYDLFHYGEFIYELEQLTGTVGLIDPHLVGAGFSRFRKGSDLKIHYDLIGMIDYDYIETYVFFIFES